jgi:hypothetical protein
MIDYVHTQRAHTIDTPAPRSHTPNPTSSASHYLSSSASSPGHARSRVLAPSSFSGSPLSLHDSIDCKSLLRFFRSSAAHCFAIFQASRFSALSSYLPHLCCSGPPLISPFYPPWPFLCITLLISEYFLYLPLQILPLCGHSSSTWSCLHKQL